MASSPVFTGMLMPVAPYAPDLDSQDVTLAQLCLTLLKPVGQTLLALAARPVPGPPVPPPGNRLSVDGRLSIAGGDIDRRTPPPSPPLSHLRPGAHTAAADGLHAAAAQPPSTRASADLSTRMLLIPEPAAHPTSHDSIAAAAAVAAIGDGAAAAEGVPAVQVLLAAEDDPPGRRLVRAKAGSMMRRHGGLAAAMGRWLKLQLQEHRRAWLITWVVIKVCGRAGVPWGCNAAVVVQVRCTGALVACGQRPRLSIRCYAHASSLYHCTTLLSFVSFHSNYGPYICRTTPTHQCTFPATRRTPCCGRC